jgi:pyridoxamine 5'-phosphate oxidase
VNDDEAYRPVPRVRSLVHRSFVALRGAKQDAGSVVLQTTTDIRSAKASHLNVGEQGIRSTRNVEVVWWFPASQVQFRLLCTGYVLPHPSHPWRDAFPADLDTGDGGVGDGGVTDWEGVRIACFNTLSPYLRASFARPLTPGSELTNPDEAQNWPNKLPA